MTIETERLVLRPWVEEDAESLYEYARDPRVGPMAGWPVHTSVENSLEIIQTVLGDSYAITIKGDNRAVGSIGVFPIRNLPQFEGETEIGYWIAVPFWGQGLVPEAVRELLRILFEEKGENRVWCGHYEGNGKSKRVIEKCGFEFVLKQESYVPLMEEHRVELFYKIEKADYCLGR